MAQIYGPQYFLTAYEEPVDGFYKSSDHGGADPPVAAYPEFAMIDGLKVIAGGGPSGENVMDLDTAFVYDTYPNTGAAMLGLGSEGDDGDMWDNTEETTIEWEQFFSSVAVADVAYGQVMVTVAKTGSIAPPGTPDPEVGLFTGDSVIFLGFEPSGGGSFVYDLYYSAGPTGDTTINKRSDAGGGWTITDDTGDDAWHNIKIVSKPGTVNGPQSGYYFPRDADGYLRIYKDDVLIFEATNITLGIAINFYNAYGSQPNMVYGVWHGFAGLLGKFTGLQIYNGEAAPTPTSLPDPVLVSSVPTVCCEPPQVNKANTPGPIEPMIDPTWYPLCEGLGTVPTAPDLIDPESWIT